MRVFGFSSATKIISIGLIDEEKILVETTMADMRAERVLFYAEEAGIKPDQIEAVAVAIGPGSYSGLRGGAAAAKSLSQSLNIPLIGVSTLEAIAYNLIDIEGTMAVILDARSKEYNFALFGAHQGQLKRLTNDLVLDYDQIVKQFTSISGQIHLVGNCVDFKKQLQGDNYLFADENHAHPYGINVAKLGLLKIKAGQTDDPLNLSPNYSHKPKFKEYMN